MRADSDAARGDEEGRETEREGERERKEERKGASGAGTATLGQTLGRKTVPGGFRKRECGPARCRFRGRSPRGCTPSPARPACRRRRGSGRWSAG
eukprot:2441093-Rhodomonas_salina.2